MAAVLCLKRIAVSPTWRATVTPLASIIGSGFLILGPILHQSFGWLAPLVMLVLCVLAYLFGEAIRSNIKMLSGNTVSNYAFKLDRIASGALGFAYIISVAYYLNLLGAFSVSMTPFNNDFNAKLITN